MWGTLDPHIWKYVFMKYELLSSESPSEKGMGRQSGK